MFFRYIQTLKSLIFHTLVALWSNNNKNYYHHHQPTISAIISFDHRLHSNIFLNTHISDCIKSHSLFWICKVIEHIILKILIILSFLIKTIIINHTKDEAKKNNHNKNHVIEIIIMTILIIIIIIIILSFKIVLEILF